MRKTLLLEFNAKLAENVVVNYRLFPHTGAERNPGKEKEAFRRRRRGPRDQNAEQEKEVWQHWQEKGKEIQIKLSSGG